MSSPPLLTIGMFARAVGLSTSALRHYDECGLLVPAEVDDTTGYRYYTPDLAERARLIVGMREAGVPIGTMRLVLDGTPAQAREAICSFREEQAARSVRAGFVLDDVLAAKRTGVPGARTASARLEGPVLAAALRQVRPAAEGDPASPLSAVLLDVTEDAVDAVATNRYWMAVRTLGAPRATAGAARVALPLPVVAELASLLDRVDDVLLELSGDRLTVRSDAEEWSAEGRTSAYPAHRIVLDGLEPPRTRAVCSTAALSGAIREVGRAEVTVALSCEGARIDDPDGPGTQARRLDVDVRGEDVRLRLGTALIQRGLAACVGAEVLVEVVSGARPVVLRSPYQPGFLALVMPVAPA